MKNKGKVIATCDAEIAKKILWTLLSQLIWKFRWSEKFQEI